MLLKMGNTGEQYIISQTNPLHAFLRVGLPEMHAKSHYWMNPKNIFTPKKQSMNKVSLKGSLFWFF
jgi:hypothetical protein